MNLPRYSAYKPSGVPWLGEIPAHWEVKRLKYLANCYGGGTPSKGNAEYWNGDIPWVSPKDMACQFITDSEDHITEEAIQESATKIIEQGAVLVVVRSGILRHTIPVAINKVRVALNQDLKALVPQKMLRGEFLKYYIQGLNGSLLDVWSKMGCTVESIETEYMLNSPFPVVPLPEQAAIAAFLDRETARIDSLIEKKRRFIELLQEKRSALISHAVTRGLNPDAPLKDSGIEWLGRIPTHWAIKRLKFSLDHIEQGWSPLCENSQADMDQWGVLKVGCVNGNEFDETENKTLPADIEPIAVYEINSGDILMSRANTRELLGSVALVKSVRPKLLLCDKLYRLRIHKDLTAPFLVFFMRSPLARYQYERDSTGASGSMQNIGQDTVKNLLVPIPPAAEQEMIMAHLDRETARLDTLRTKVESAIDRLKEYRAALITAAVTGKIDVREAA